MAQLSKGMKDSMNELRGESLDIRDDIRGDEFRECACYAEYCAMGVRVTNNALKYERIIKSLTKGKL